MPMTLEERKTEIDQLLARFKEHVNQARDVQKEIGEMLNAAGETHGTAAWPLVEEAIRKMKVIALATLPVESVYKM